MAEEREALTAQHVEVWINRGKIGRKWDVFKSKSIASVRELRISPENIPMSRRTGLILLWSVGFGLLMGKTDGLGFFNDTPPEPTPGSPLNVNPDIEQDAYVESETPVIKRLDFISGSRKVYLSPKDKLNTLQYTTADRIVFHYEPIFKEKTIPVENLTSKALPANIRTHFGVPVIGNRVTTIDSQNHKTTNFIDVYYVAQNRRVQVGLWYLITNEQGKPVDWNASSSYLKFFVPANFVATQ